MRRAAHAIPELLHLYCNLVTAPGELRRYESNFSLSKRVGAGARPRAEDTFDVVSIALVVGYRVYFKRCCTKDRRTQIGGGAATVARESRTLKRRPRTIRRRGGFAQGHSDGAGDNVWSKTAACQGDFLRRGICVGRNRS